MATNDSNAAQPNEPTPDLEVVDGGNEFMSADEIEALLAEMQKQNELAEAGAPDAAEPAMDPAIASASEAIETAVAEEGAPEVVAEAPAELEPVVAADALPLEDGLAELSQLMGGETAEAEPAPAPAKPVAKGVPAVDDPVGAALLAENIEPEQELPVYVPEPEPEPVETAVAEPEAPTTGPAFTMDDVLRAASSSTSFSVDEIKSFEPREEPKAEPDAIAEANVTVQDSAPIEATPEPSSASQTQVDELPNLPPERATRPPRYKELQTPKWVITLVSKLKRTPRKALMIVGATAAVGLVFAGNAFVVSRQVKRIEKKMTVHEAQLERSIENATAQLVAMNGRLAEFDREAVSSGSGRPSALDPKSSPHHTEAPSTHGVEAATHGETPSPKHPAHTETPKVTESTHKPAVKPAPHGVESATHAKAPEKHGETLTKHTEAPVKHGAEPHKTTEHAAIAKAKPHVDPRFKDGFNPNTLTEGFHATKMVYAGGKHGSVNSRLLAMRPGASAPKRSTSHRVKAQTKSASVKRRAQAKRVVRKPSSPKPKNSIRVYDASGRVDTR